MAFLPCPLRESTLNRPDESALLVDGHSVSFLMLDTLVEQYRDALARQGLQPGDKLVVLTHDPVQTIILIVACLRSGWLFCPVNPGFPVERMSDYCRRIQAEKIISGSIETMLPEELAVLQLPAFSHVPNEVSSSLQLDLDKICDLIATSGTTGTPKAVAHTLSNHLFSARGSQQQIPLQAGDCWLLSLPLFHVGGLGIVIRCLLAGATMVIDTHKTRLAELLPGSGITHVSLVNTQLHRLLKADGCDLSATALKCMLLGGGAASPELVRQVQEAGVRILTTYGMTEMSSQVCTGTPEFTKQGVTSGQVLPYREIQLDDSGEILVRGKTLCKGYYNDGRIVSVADDSGWYHSGDKGEWLGDQLRVTGRIDNMMISGGENIHPEEIEQALLSIDGIVQAVVVAVADGEFGERPVAFVETVADNFDEVFTKRTLAGKISRFKIPDRIELFPASALNTGLKPDRRYFQELAKK